MARDESDREDLLREATALVERVELTPAAPSVGDNVVVGFRADGAMSVFFGTDPVYQFNAAGELRRAFCDGQLFKAIRGQLVALRRVRQPNEVQLLRRDLTETEQESLLSTVTLRLRSFVQQLDAGGFAVVGQVPPQADVVGRVRKWFVDHPTISVANLPNVGR